MRIDGGVTTGYTHSKGPRDALRRRDGDRWAHNTHTTHYTLHTYLGPAGCVATGRHTIHTLHTTYYTPPQGPGDARRRRSGEERTHNIHIEHYTLHTAHLRRARGMRGDGGAATGEHGRRTGGVSTCRFKTRTSLLKVELIFPQIFTLFES